MSTLKQKAVARELAEHIKAGKFPTTSCLLEKAGYRRSVARHTPRKVLESAGVRQALAESGVSVERIDSVVNGILETGQEQNRLKASDILYKRLGAYAPTKSISVNVTADIARIEAETIKILRSLSRRRD